MCDKDYTVGTFEYNIQKYCSKKCAGIAKIGVPNNGKTKLIELVAKNCLTCSNAFFVSNKNKYNMSRKYCSFSCYNVINTERARELGKSNTKYSPEEIKKRNLEAGRRSYRKNIDTRLIYYRKLDAKRRGASGTFSKEEWNLVLEKQNYICLGCDIFMEKPTIDHIIPISKWEDWEKQNNPNYKCNDIENIQALCKRCNCIKSNKL